MSRKSDTLFSTALSDMVDFRFDERVVDVFPDMIQRSVPGYATIISMIGVLAGHYATAGSRCYDLGCSLGAASLAMQQNIRVNDCEIIAVDNSKPMIDRAAEIINNSSDKTPITLLCDDIQNIEISKAAVVVMNFTLQFIPLEQRQALIQKIYDGMQSGGILVLSEKLHAESQQQDEFLIAAHHDFKRANGYSDLEISQKRTALENVLIPETLQQHQQRLSEVGFSFSSQWYQCFNFASLVAKK
jgi:tRNA (cmo5U34)-methyltransferase